MNESMDKKDEETLRREAEREEDLSFLDGVSMVQDGMEAFIFPANFDNNFQADYYDEF